MLFGSGRIATNDKVAKLARLTSEARYEYLVINDSDVRAEPDYLRTVVAPLADPKRRCGDLLLRADGRERLWPSICSRSACCRISTPASWSPGSWTA